MILELRLKDFVLIEEARLSFEPGFVVLIGETGAGKTLLIKGLKLLMGARGSPSLIRPGAPKAVLEAVFLPGTKTKDRLARAGLDSGEEILVRRVLTPDRSRAYLNDSPVSLGLLTETISPLITLASQHDYQRLKDPEEKLAILDTFANLWPLREKYEEQYRKLKELERELEKQREKLQNSLKEEDFLRFQIKEIEDVAPQIGEDQELEEKVKVFKNLTQLEEHLKRAARELDAALSALGRGRKELREAANLSKELGSLRERAEDLYYELEDFLAELNETSRKLPRDFEDLEQLEDRLYQLRRLKRKYGPSLEDVLHYLAQLKKQLAELSYGEEHLAGLEDETARVREETLALAQELHLKRKEAAHSLGRAVRKILPLLALKETRFEIELKEGPLTSSGKDRVDFLVATQPQAPLRPLNQVASGGELSRLFLALKVASARGDSGEILVFDEVDTGIGGEVAAKVGKLLKELAQHNQVICVTHQPQIAALAEQHFYIEKQVGPGKAATVIKELTPGERVAEIARMLGGPEARDLARKMLAV